jgi:signal transduction histidine kinase/ligand-binding sensor domain-containing protein
MPPAAARRPPSWLRLTRRWIGSVLFSILAGAACAESDAPPVGVGLAQFGVQRWTAADGLDGNWVRGLAVDADGTLWVATSYGLSRFDGHAFSRLRGASGDPAEWGVSVLALGVDGGVSVGAQYAGVIEVRAPTGRASIRPPRLTDHEVHAIAYDRNGTLWAGTNAGLWAFDNDGGAGVAVAPDDAALSAEVRTITRAADGALWARTAQHGLWRIEGRTAVRMPDLDSCIGYGFAIGADDERFMSCRAGVWRWDGRSGAWTAISSAFGVGPIHLDRRGDLWFGSREGLVRWSQGRIELLSPERGLGDWRVRAIAEDARGDLWFGTFSGGLARLHRGPVRTYGTTEGLPIDATTAVLAEDGGGLWIGALAGGLRHFHPERGPGMLWGPEQGLPGETAWALAQDPRTPGALWVGADRGLAWLSEGQLAANGPQGERYSGIVHTLYPDPAEPDTLWLSGADTGAIALRGANRFVHDERRGLPVGRVRVFLRDHRGRMLAGGHEGLFVLEGDGWRRFDPGGVQLTGVTALAEEADGRLWVASDRQGLLSIDGGDAHIWGLAEGLPFSPIHSIEFDRQGGLWLSGNEGLARIRLADHARWAGGASSAIPIERIGRRDGLREPECNGWGAPASTQLADGRLVYPTIAGIGLVDPDALPSVGLSPSEIFIREAWAGTRALDPSAGLVLRRDERALRITFSAVELLRPEAVAFRYRLGGVDPDWITAGRAREAAWSPLPPGEFLFELQARLPGQPWVDVARPIDVSVRPQMWQSSYLRALAAALVLLAAIAAVRWRINIERAHTLVVMQDRDRLRRSRAEARALSEQVLRAQEDERQRLAREIHDDLSQQLAGLSMLAWSTAQAAAREPGVNRHVALEDLAYGIEQLAREVQSLSHDLHPPALDALGLAAALRGECATFTNRTGLAVRFVEVGAVIDAPAEVALATYRIAQEALRNCLNHSGAREVEVRLHGGQEELSLAISDDGVGFDPDVAARSGIGLSSMRERARLAGISFSNDSQPGAGTRILLRWQPPSQA